MIDISRVYDRTNPEYRKPVVDELTCLLVEDGGQEVWVPLVELPLSAIREHWNTRSRFALATRSAYGSVEVEIPL